MENINEICFELFDVSGKVYEMNSIFCKKPAYRLDVCSLVLNSYLHNIFKINRGTKKNLRIPKQFFQNKDITKWYLIGLFDADGTLPRNPDSCKQAFIDVTFKDKEFITQIRGLLETFDIKTLKPYCRIAKSPNSDYISKTWELRIRKKEDMIKFLSKVGFFHPNKRERAEKLLKHLSLWPSLDRATSD